MLSQPYTFHISFVLTFSIRYYMFHPISFPLTLNQRQDFCLHIDISYSTHICTNYCICGNSCHLSHHLCFTHNILLLDHCFLRYAIHLLYSRLDSFLYPPALIYSKTYSCANFALLKHGSLFCNRLVAFHGHYRIVKVKLKLYPHPKIG